MKNTLIKSGLILIATAFMFSGCAASSNTAQTQAPAPADITYQTFYDELSPYGTWIDYPGYGHVWNPGVTGDFRPYATNGYWLYSTEGWAWQSNYNWGWAPFHYGRWLYDDMYGWLWVPGYDWSPAWVTWGSVDNYYAWAPLMPEVNLRLQYSSWMPHAYYWNICGRDHIYDRNIGDVIQKPERNSSFANRISIINNFNTTHVNNLYYSKGPDVYDVEKYTNRKIEPVAIKEVNNINQVKHEGNQVNIFRPKVQNPQPREFRKVENNEVKPLRSDGEWPSKERSEQTINVERLSRQNTTIAPAPALRPGRGGMRTHR